MLRSSRLLSAFAAVALFLVACHSTRTTGPSAPSDPLAALTYDGDQSTLVALDRDIAAAGQDSAKLAAISSRLLAVLRTPAATGAARQAAAQRLALFPAATLATAENSALWIAMAADERQINFVKLALDHASGPAVDDIFLRALEASAPADRLAWVQSIGNRRIAAAVPKLAPFLDSSDPANASATAKALGQIGTSDALVALKKSSAAHSPAVVEARLVAAHQLGGAATTHEFEAILDDSSAPANLRAAALHSLLFADPDIAPARIVAALHATDAVAKPVVIETIASLSSKNLVPALTADLPSFEPAIQAAVLTALGRRGDVSAVPAVADLARSPNASVRAAALTALGRLPANPTVVNLLAQVATGDIPDDAKLARQSLARLAGPRVVETITAGATNAAPAQRAVFLDALATRNMTEALPLLLDTRSDPNVSVRIAALAALADLASPAEQKAILDWALAATDAGEQSRALRTLAAVTLRNPDTAGRARFVTDAIDRAAPAVALRLLPVLPRIGGIAAAECAARLALHDDPALATAATTTLTRWPNADNLLPLVVVAEKAPHPVIRDAAVDGAIRSLQRDRELASANLHALVTRLLAVAKTDAPRRQLVYLLGRCTDSDTLADLAKLQSDPVLASDAQDALLAIRSNQSGRPSLRSSANSEQLRFLIDGKLRSTWNVPALADQWIELDFKTPRPFRQVVVDGGDNQYNYPEHLEITVTDDPKNPGAPQASVEGRVGKNVVDLPVGLHGRYLIIRNSKAREDSWWTVAELTWD